jgi:integrase/recombinase XerD
MTDLRAAAGDYLALRRALGFKLVQAERMLRSLVDHLQEQGAPAITTQTALQWATLPGRAKPWWWRQRLTAARGFARYLQAFDPSTEVPPAGMIYAPVTRRAPYPFSDADITALLQAAGQLTPPLRRATYQTLIGLLVVTGMRVGEAIALDTADVDMVEGLIVVRHAKFGKSRELVLHPTSVEALTCYRQTLQRYCPRPVTPAFFVSTVGTRLHYPNVSALFRRLTQQAGLPNSPHGRPARLHDLRHLFAVRTLTDWHAAGLEVGPLLPALSTYLGHTQPADTYWYLTATPDLLQQAAQRLEKSQEAPA